LQQPQRICYSVFRSGRTHSVVMAALVPAIHAFNARGRGFAGQAPDVRDARDREKGTTRGCAMMMKIRIAVVALAIGMSPALAAPIPVALVEEVSGAPAGVEFMDYVETGKTIELGARGGIVLSYLNACVRETISGGTVTVGTGQSDVQGEELPAPRCLAIPAIWR